MGTQSVRQSKGGPQPEGQSGCQPVVACWRNASAAELRNGLVPPPAARLPARRRRRQPAPWARPRPRRCRLPPPSPLPALSRRRRRPRHLLPPLRAPPGDARLGRQSLLHQGPAGSAQAGGARAGLHALPPRRPCQACKTSRLPCPRRSTGRRLLPRLPHPSLPARRRRHPRPCPLRHPPPSHPGACGRSNAEGACLPATALLGGLGESRASVACYQGALTVAAAEGCGAVGVGGWVGGCVCVWGGGAATACQML
jgi:hypothetical protein